MTTFEYLAALVSVVVGLGMAQTLRGLSHLVHGRASVRVHGPHLMWAANVMLWMVIFWWFSFGLVELPEWRLPDLIWVLLYASGIYFLTSLVFPDPMPADFDGVSHFHDNRSWFFGALFCVGLLEVGDYWVKTIYQGVLPAQTGVQLALYLTLLGLWLPGSLVASRIRNDTFHWAYAIAFFIAEASWASYISVWSGI